MKKEGVFRDVYEVSGNLIEYISKSAYGGRVSVNKKYVKKIVTGKIADYDGVSLYPSAINRLCRESGLPTGPARRLTDLDKWESYIHSIMTVKITKVNKIQQMPFIAHRTEDSILYKNEAPEQIVIIDKLTLQDYIKFHDIEYEILDGVYWNGGINKKMGEIIQKLFTTRLKYKKTKPDLANVIKLMLNASYGKTLTKKTKSERKIIKAVS